MSVNMEIETTMIDFEATEVSIKDGSSGTVSLRCELDNRDIESLLSQLPFEELKKYVFTNI